MSQSHNEEMDIESANAIAEQLDSEIQLLKDQVASLRRALQIETSTILSASSTHNQLASGNLSTNPNADLFERSAKQQAHMQQCLHRTTNPVTAFKVQDPDPNAVDNGHVLGLRFEIMSRGQFIRPHYVMLNRPYTNAAHLRVHRHTIPPAIPLAGLAARHLPSPPRPGAEASSPGQDLDRFSRALRREIVRYYNRLGVSADLRRGLRLHESREGEPRDDDVVDIGIADVEAKQITMTWADDRTGRLVIDDDGVVEKMVVLGKEGKDWITMKGMARSGERVEEVARRIARSKAS